MTFEDWDDLDDTEMTCEWLCKEFEMTFGWVLEWLQMILEWLQMILEWLQMTLGWHSDDFVMILPTAFKPCFLSYSIRWRRQNLKKISLAVLTLLTLTWLIKKACSHNIFHISLLSWSFFQKILSFCIKTARFLGGAHLLGRSE